MNEIERRAHVTELVGLQKSLVWSTKTSIMIKNRLLAFVATSGGYYSTMKESERIKAFTEAGKRIERIMSEEESSDIDEMVISTMQGLQGFDSVMKNTVKEMKIIVKKLPIYKWLKENDQLGLGEKSLAVVIGEAGDLCDYDRPGKLWKRMGCAPYKSKEKMQMGSTWLRNKKDSLSKEEWVDFGYCPRRRAEAYVIGTCLLKANGEGPYRQRYNKARLNAAKSHPEWLVCSKCSGTGVVKSGKKCDICKGEGTVTMHLHKHAQLLMTKLLLKNVWMEWNKLEGTLPEKPAYVNH